ncbi:MAG: phosphoribosylanthranilate isomerase [Deltaproteobacteria bacterium]|nr:phosphoribosylanthranilate isomerase [Deltaproteobacteria bacterium]
MNKKFITPQIKICGLTKIKQAVECEKLGSNAIGLVFHPKSPRYIGAEKAKQITSALSEKTITTGVFVNEKIDSVLKIIEKCKLKAVQLHGDESPAYTDQLIKKKIFVIKALFIQKKPFISDVSAYNASAYLIEYGKGSLPGGNALQWNWEKAKNFGTNHPLILAGGINADNISDAAISAAPDAIDISSGVETSPGNKNILKVKEIINKLSDIKIAQRQLRRIF